MCSECTSTRRERERDELSCWDTFQLSLRSGLLCAAVMPCLCAVNSFTLMRVLCRGCVFIYLFIFKLIFSFKFSFVFSAAFSGCF